MEIDEISSAPLVNQKIHVAVFDERLVTKISVFYCLMKKFQSQRPQFSTNPTFGNPLKNPSSYLVKAGF